ncbi:polysaccharide biosynthesis C-terminal domain-containing protein [Nocardioides daejeonensis]|uniref:oligosaccharide flippase family protein n=1 Tax=Nocardioides daejeonensis TaxID=1046556 RepID=UPI000D74B97A|nr:lipopolysaccharide biosynthesis protein [Nocardioides daejeonensis]
MSSTRTLQAAVPGHLATLARGGALGLAGSAVAGVAGFALVALVARGLSPENAGAFFAITAGFVLVEGMAVLGTDTGLARFLLRHEARGGSADILALLRNARAVCLTVAVTVTLSGIAVSGALGTALGWGAETVTALRIALCVLPAAVLADISLGAARALTELRSTALIDRLLRAGLQPVAVGFALLGGAGLAGVAAAWAASHVVAAVAALHSLRATLRRRGHSGSSPRPASPGVRQAFWRFTWLRGLARMAQIGMQKADILVVAALVSPTAAAAYTVATRFVPLGQLSTQAVQQVLQPRLTEILVHDDRATLREIYRVATAWCMLLAWPLHLTVLMLAGHYLALFGPAAASTDHAPLVVVVMALTMLVAVASGPVDTLLLMSGRSLASAGNTALALVIDLSLCLLLIPGLGIVGAAIAWAAAVVSRCALAFWQVGRSQRVHPFSRITLTAASVTTVCVGLPCGLLALSDVDGWWLLLGLAGSGALFVASLYRFRSGLALDQAWRGLATRDSEAWR